MQYCSNCNNIFIIEKNLAQDVKPEDKAIFKCTSCEYTESIKPHAMIISRSSITHGSEVSSFTTKKYKEHINDPALPHSRNYVCPNKECTSHKDHAKRDVVWFKPEMGYYKTIYICTACETVF